MLIDRLLLMIFSTILPFIYCQTIVPKQLINILSSLQPFQSQYCQFKFENCVQDSTYADQFTSDCQIYARLRNCYSFLLDDEFCRSDKTRKQYERTRQNEYKICTSISRRLNFSSSCFFLFLLTKIFILDF